MLTTEEQKIMATLSSGEKNLITYKTIAWRTKISEREVRAIVAHLVTDHYICICTTSNGGYFIASNYEEYDHAHRELLSRIKALSRRARGLRLGYMKDVNIDKQLKLV